MDVRGAPTVEEIPPRIRARLYGPECVIALSIGNRAAATTKVRIDRRHITVVLVPVASACIGLPKLDQCVRDRAAGLVLDIPMNGAALPHRPATPSIIEVDV